VTQATPAIPLGSNPTKRAWPGPRRGLGGSIWEAWEDPLGLFTDALRDHGDYVRFSFGWLHYHTVADPRGAHHILVENAKNYVKSRNYAGLKLMLGQGLLTSEGEYWKRQRRLAQPAFHRQRLAGFATTMAACTSDMLARWERDLVPGRVRFDMHAELMRLTFRIVGRTLLSTELDGVARDFGDALNVALKWTNDYVESVVKVPPWIPTPANVRFRRAQKVIDGLVMRIIAERRAEAASGRPSGEGDARHDDLLGMLMEVKDETTGESMSDQQLKDELVTLVLAGHETTANALAFAMYLLSSYPEVARRVRDEADAVLGTRDPELADLPKLTYAKAVMEEAMRLFPPAWVVERDALEADEVGGLAIPKGGTVAVSPFVLHRHPALWENPEGFDPERFLKPDPARHKLAYMPFGAGPRLCIGNAFAMMEMQIVLPMIVRRMRAELEPNARVELDPSVTLRPKHGVPMRLRPI
jgi:cytochrome P450